MNTFMVILCILIVICVVMIYSVATYNHFQDYIIRINEADVNIDATLRKRFDLLNKAITIIKSNTKTKEEVLEPIVKLRSKKISNFELDRKLYDCINEFQSYKEKFPKLTLDEEYLKIEIGLMESESEIVGLRKYYNDIVTDYNKMVKSCPSNLIAMMKKYKAKDYFDGTNVDKENDTIKL